jgi:hypothetical protein
VTVLKANTELVAVSWLKGVSGLGNGMVGTTLPDDTSTWSTNGFVTVRVVGGAPGIYVPMRNPVVSLDFWAISPSSSKPPWGRAANLAELVRLGTDQAGRRVTLPAGFPTVVEVKKAWFVSEPRRAFGDVGSYAHFIADMQMSWVEVAA